MKPPYAIGSVPSLSGHAIAYRWRSLPRVRRHRASKPQGSSERVLPWKITMDQLIFASLSHTHYWYEVGMLKVPACVFLRRRGRNVSRSVGRSYWPPIYTTTKTSWGRGREHASWTVRGGAVPMGANALLGIEGGRGGGVEAPKQWLW